MSQVAIISFSAQGENLAQHIRALMLPLGWEADATRCPKGSLGNWVSEHFPKKDALIFIGSCGLAVRAIAGQVRNKTEDPAVVVIDESGCFAVALLSGHLGGANQLTEDLAELIGATPVITTATDRRGIFAVDSWAKSQGLTVLNPERIVEVSSKLLAGKQVYFASDLPIKGPVPQGLIELGYEQRAITPDFRVSLKAGKEATALELIAPVISVGIGCRRGTEREVIESVVKDCLEQVGASPEAVLRIASINLKAEEPGLLALAAAWGLELYTYSAEQLNALAGSFTGSEFVCRVTGTDNVCERAAVCGLKGAKLILTKTAGQGVTVALAQVDLTLSFSKER
ncbi:MAG: cobalamin biosynthesis protein [Eubacteriales bacterium]|nr:cobalamin biosynthesis protein [Eubacteriales bacterium]